MSHHTTKLFNLADSIFLIAVHSSGGEIEQTLNHIISYLNYILSMLFKYTRHKANYFPIFSVLLRPIECSQKRHKYFPDDLSFFLI